MKQRLDELVKEAKELYGEIKPGDRFYFPFLDGKIYSLLDGHNADYTYIENKSENEEFLEYQGVLIYYNGKWAEKLEPVPKGVLKFKSDEARMMAEILRIYKHHYLDFYVKDYEHEQPYESFLNNLQEKCEKTSKDKRRRGYITKDTDEDFHNRILKKWTKK
jgi:hypothetical protein